MVPQLGQMAMLGSVDVIQETARIHAMRVPGNFWPPVRGRRCVMKNRSDMLPT